MTRGEKICAFIERYCLIPEGAQVGQPIKLIKFQRKFILDVFDNPHGTSRAYLSVYLLLMEIFALKLGTFGVFSTKRGK